MSLPSWIPKVFRQLIVTARPFDPEQDDIDDLLPKDFQKETMQQASFNTDKGRAVKHNAEQIRRVRAYLKSDDPEDQERLGEWNEWLERLYVERYALLKNEILNACKTRGLLDEKKLASFPGSPEYRRRKAKQKERYVNRQPKNEPENVLSKRRSNDRSKREDSDVNPDTD